MNPDSLSHSSFWVELYSALAIVGCVVVVIGVVLEGVELLVKFRESIRCRRWMTEVFGKNWRTRLVLYAKYVKPRLFWPFEILAFAILVLGLVIELFGSFGEQRMQSKENAILERENTILEHTNLQLLLYIEELRSNNAVLENKNLSVQSNMAVMLVKIEQTSNTARLLSMQTSNSLYRVQFIPNGNGFNFRRINEQ